MEKSKEENDLPIEIKMNDKKTIYDKNIIPNDKMDELDTCCICLDFMKKEDLCCFMRNCTHKFHTNCIHLWVQKEKHKFCPLCRAKGKLKCSKNQFKNIDCKKYDVEYRDPKAFIRNLSKKRKNMTVLEKLNDTLKFTEYLNHPSIIYKSLNMDKKQSIFTNSQY